MMKTVGVRRAPNLSAIVLPLSTRTGAQHVARCISRFAQQLDHQLSLVEGVAVAVEQSSDSTALGSVGRVEFNLVADVFVDQVRVVAQSARASSMTSAFAGALMPPVPKLCAARPRGRICELAAAIRWPRICRASAGANSSPS